MGYAVAAGHPLAVDEADRALRKGANAVEAALVAAFVQGVVDPAKCGIGGWGVAAVGPPDGAVTIIDFPARAGGRARPDMWRDLLTQRAYHGYLPVLKGHVNDVGYQAIGVPSAVAGYAELHARFGARWSWADLLVPAIHYARDGVPVYGGVLGAGPPEWDWPGAVPFADRLAVSAAGGRRYLRGKRFFKVGEILRQPELAGTLETLASGGPATFYQGSIADRIARDMARHGGLVTAEDLATCRPAVTQPVVGQFGTWAIHAPPPPESGVSLLQILALLDGILDSAEGPFGLRNVRELVAALEFAAVQRARYLSDPAFVEVPIVAMLAEAARGRATRGGAAGAPPNVPGVVAQRDTTSIVGPRDLDESLPRQPRRIGRRDSRSRFPLQQHDGRFRRRPGRAQLDRARPGALERRLSHYRQRARREPAAGDYGSRRESGDRGGRPGRVERAGVRNGPAPGGVVAPNRCP